MSGYVVFLESAEGNFQTRHVLPYKRPLPKCIRYGGALYTFEGNATYRQRTFFCEAE